MIFFPSVLTPGKQFLAWLGAYCDFQVGCLRMTCIYLVRKQSWFSAGSPCLLNNALGFVLLMDGILKQPAIMVQDLLVAWGSKNLFRYLPVWGRWTLSCYDGRSECGQPCLGKSVSGVTRGGENFENGKVKCSWELLCTCCWWKRCCSPEAKCCWYGSMWNLFPLRFFQRKRIHSRPEFWFPMPYRYFWTGGLAWVQQEGETDKRINVTEELKAAHQNSD